MREVTTFSDLRYLRQTSSKGWFDGCISQTSLKKSPVKLGEDVEESYHLLVSSTSCRIVRRVSYVSEVTSNASYYVKYRQEDVAKFCTIEDFRSSEWYDAVMEKFSDGNSDSSWMGQVEVDDQLVKVDTNVFTCHDTYVSMKVGSTYVDWLNNIRQSSNVNTLSFNVDRMSGAFTVSCGSDVVEDVTVSELKAALSVVSRLKDLGISVTEDSITVPLANPEERV